MSVATAKQSADSHGRFFHSSHTPTSEQKKDETADLSANLTDEKRKVREQTDAKDECQLAVDLDPAHIEREKHCTNNPKRGNHVPCDISGSK